MRALRLANLRSLEDTGLVEIRPITLLLGTNSSGKSSFLRAFPLLKQSVETARSNPILWFGRYVDFGSIGEAINFSSSAKELTFGFSFEVNPRPRTVFQRSPQLPTGLCAEVHLTLIPTEEFGSRVSACRIGVAHKEIVLRFDSFGIVSEFTIDKRSVLPAGNQLRLADTAVLIPTLTSDPIVEGDRAVVYQPFTPHASLNFGMSPFSRRRGERPMDKAALGSIRALMRRNSNEQRLQAILQSVHLGIDSELRNDLDRRLGGQKPASKRNPEIMERLIAELWARAVPELLSAADEQVSNFIANSLYLGPLRATAQRYYRAQDLSVSEVDFRGENLAMFLRSLSDTDQRSLSDFTEKHFGFTVARSGDAGHVAIHVRHSDASHNVNLADTGFGYSQMLPLIALLWSAVNRPRSARSRNEPIMIAMEQPELHLHPAHQAHLADMFASVSRERNIRLMIETHSEAMVNRFGELIAGGDISCADVQLAIFEHDEAAQLTKLRLAGYDEQGNLTADWPFGFFSA